MPTCASVSLSSIASAARNSFSAAPGRRCSNRRQPSVSELLRVGSGRRRRGGLLVGGEVALLVLLPRAAGAGVVAAGGGEARAGAWLFGSRRLASWLRRPRSWRRSWSRASSSVWSSFCRFRPCWGRDHTLKILVGDHAAARGTHDRAPRGARAGSPGRAGRARGGHGAALPAGLHPRRARPRPVGGVAARARGRRLRRPHLPDRRGAAAPAGDGRAARHSRRRRGRARARPKGDARPEAGARAARDRPFVGSRRGRCRPRPA